MATVVSAGGGTWDYGAGTAIVWSDYYHGTKCHGSTAVGEYIDSDEPPRLLVLRSGRRRSERQQVLLEHQLLTGAEPDRSAPAASGPPWW
ncbi:hypothetical protein StrepF001_13335 [Streptomyces sp. F001]|nr:hypothetical protein StrepF001_13335 [Streptomyces sp. F001]